MKINEVERRVGITKKNIRFYEDQGLINPGRNDSNGYREYSEADVEFLLKIKLLRRLGVPIEEIRKMLAGKLTLSDCMDRHQVYLNHEKHNLELTGEVCQRLKDSEVSLSDLEADSYLTQLDEMEKGGIRFMNVTKTDIAKKKRGARIAAIVMIVLVIIWDLIIVTASIYDPMPLPVLLLMTVPATAVIVGVVIALRERIKEIDKGEEDEAADY